MPPTRRADTRQLRRLLFSKRIDVQGVYRVRDPSLINDYYNPRVYCDKILVRHYKLSAVR